MTTTAKKAPKTLRPTRIEIKAIESQYTEGDFASVVANLGFTFAGQRISHVEERRGAAFGHRLVADLLESSPSDEHWNLSTEVTGSYRDIVEIRVAIELCNGDSDEMARAKALLTTATERL